MTREPIHRTILVGTDFSALGELAIARATAFADAFGARRLHVVHVAQMPPAWTMPDVGDTSALSFQSLKRASETALERLPVYSRHAEVTRELRYGSAAPELARAAEEVKADLIVLATHGRGRVGRFFLGSVANALLRGAPCPVLVVGEDRRGPVPLRTVIAAADLSPISDRVIEEAKRVARDAEAKLRVVSVSQHAQALPHDALLANQVELLRARHRELLQQRAEKHRDGSVAMQVDLVSAPSSTQGILETADATGAELIVLGASGHNAFDRFLLGSTASKVVPEAHCAVLVVPNPAQRP